MRQGATQVLAKTRTNFIGKVARRLQKAFECLHTFGQLECFELGRASIQILANEYKVMGIGHQYEAIAFPITTHLIARSDHPCVIACGFHLNHTAFWYLPLAWSALLHLTRCIKTEIGMACTLISQLDHARHFRLERIAYDVQQVGKRPVE